MKKFLLTFSALILFTFTAHSQKWFAAASFGYSFEDNNDEAIPYLHFMPSVNYFITKNFSLGLGLGFEYWEYMDIATYSLVIAPSFFIPLGDKFYYTPHAQIGNGLLVVHDKYAPEFVYVLTMAAMPISFEYRPTTRLGINLSVGDLSARWFGMEEFISQAKWAAFNVGCRIYF